MSVLEKADCIIIQKGNRVSWEKSGKERTVKMERGLDFLFSASSFEDRGCLPFTQTNQVEILNMNINNTMTFAVVGERTAAMYILIS